MRALLLSCAAAIGFAASAHADQRFDSTLVGHAILPAFTMAVPPADAPRDAPWRAVVERQLQTLP